MDVFSLRTEVINDYSEYVSSFVPLRDDRIQELVTDSIEAGHLWPEPLLQLNPAFEAGEGLGALVDAGELHPLCRQIFCRKPTPSENHGPLQLHRHQVEGLRAARAGHSYVLTTGTGSGKSLSYIIPVVDHVLRQGSGKGICAIIVYPMNALANSQVGELQKYLEHGFSKPPVTFRRYTGQESEAERRAILEAPPDILLTNYVMLELLLTRPHERRLVEAAQGLRFLVFDELHTYRGRQGADVALLVRRVREACRAQELLHVGTSATLSGQDTWAAQQQEIARLASMLFGVTVSPQHIIGETLRRATEPLPEDPQRLVQMLRQRLEQGHLPQSHEGLMHDPLARWLEQHAGIRPEPASGRLVRCTPRPLRGERGLASDLAALTGCDAKLCEQALQATLERGYEVRDAQGRPTFAFRLHQFISKGDRVYASLEPEPERHLTLHGQQFVPGDRTRRLFPLALCRECGQEYYVVRQHRGSPDWFEDRELSDRDDEEEQDSGYLYLDTSEPWPDNPLRNALDRLPDSWIETSTDGGRSVIASRVDHVPRALRVNPQGACVGHHQPGVRAVFVGAPFLFCLRCRVEYDSRQRSDYGKLVALGSQGRSSATSLLSMTTSRQLRADHSLAPEARKLLSFTDNRQDASLQAGHFNDFIEILLLRSALLRAARATGDQGLTHDILAQRVFAALALPMASYAINPNANFAQRDSTNRALRQVLSYYLYRDLRRGWRVNAPNLEQCGLLAIDYASLGEMCADEPSWSGTHPRLKGASPEVRAGICRTLLDYLRRELAIFVDVLQDDTQESVRQMSNQHLLPAWGLDPDDTMERARIAYPRPFHASMGRDQRRLFVSARGGFGHFLRRPTTFQDGQARPNLEECEQILVSLFEVLHKVGGMLVEVDEAKTKDQVPGYQLAASCMLWRARSAQEEKAFHDPIRVPHTPEAGLRINPFFAELYTSSLDDLRDLEAHEHTAQVRSDVRQQREDDFRAGRLPLLYCSPTMELGVDIAQLNVVNMRNVPPTPANYAQRSGRAGRSGQPAFVFTYCSSGSPHDQYFFRRPELMVAGSVSTPRLDLANEDLLRAHVHAVWLSLVGLGLGSSLSEILDVEGEQPSLFIRDSIRDALLNDHARERTRQAVLRCMREPIERFLDGFGHAEGWVDQVLQELPQSFEQACERWRSLFRSAHSMIRRQNTIALDASRPSEDRERARRMRQEAEAQYRLLLASDASEQQSDFYSYRYFAAEGFLPGYNFPRLPLSAWLPGQRAGRGRDEYLQRPRFLAISEFGPRGIVYHEGARFEIHKAMLPVEGEDTSLTSAAVLCEACGYFHPLSEHHNPDLCERCRRPLPTPLDNLFAMRHVSARRRDRISSDEEERMRLGYELRTLVRFAQREGRAHVRTAQIVHEGEVLAKLEYAPSATLRRINLGWRRRAKQDTLGYLIETETGLWAKKQADPAEAQNARVRPQRRVIPFVEDRRNCLLLTPSALLSTELMATLQAALKAAVQARFELEDNELAAEPLPDEQDRRLLLFYEASEGGAGVLRRLVDEPGVLAEVARTALERCHFDPHTLDDHKRAPRASEDCTAACYDCLLSYYNQRDHRLLDRALAADWLAKLRDAQVLASPREATRDAHLDMLLGLCQSELERRFLQFLHGEGLHLPSHAQHRVPGVLVQADFFYEQHNLVVFVDGPHHDAPEQQRKDAQQTETLEDLGFFVVRFHHAADWIAVASRYPNCFGARPPERG